MPHIDTASRELQTIAGPLIRSKIRRLIGKADLREQDRLDLEQEVWSRLWPRLPAYAPGRGHSYNFLATVIERIVANLLRDRYAAKRDFRRVRSLCRRVRTRDAVVEMGQTLSQQAHDVSRGRSARGETEQVDLKRDVSQVLARLPQNQRELAEQLQFDSLAKIARRRGVPRSTLQSQIRKIRERFDDAGLGEYL